MSKPTPLLGFEKETIKKLKIKVQVLVKIVCLNNIPNSDQNKNNNNSIPQWLYVVGRKWREIFVRHYSCPSS